jgi:hypothetical protein
VKGDRGRHADLAMIHMAAKGLFGDVSTGGDGRADYEAWLERHTGARSAGKLSPRARRDLVATIRREKLIPDRPRGERPASRDADRPTRAQWAKIAGLARRLGWDEGLEDARLRGFVRRTAKIDDARFLSRSQASAVISGLEAWTAQRGTGDELPEMR